MKRKVLLLTLFVLLVSCSNDDPVTPNPNPGPTYVKANVGSTYTFEAYQTDSTGAIVGGTTKQTGVQTVVQTDVTYHGKNNVLIVRNNNSTSNDNAYFSYESNNDFSWLVTLPQWEDLPPLWVTMPVATGGAVVSTNSVTTELFPGQVSVISDSVTVTLVGDENITVKGNSIATKKMRMSIHILVVTDGVVNLDMTGVSYVYYAPSLGYFIQNEYPAIPDVVMGGWTDGNIQTLVDYDLK